MTEIALLKIEKLSFMRRASRASYLVCTCPGNPVFRFKLDERGCLARGTETYAQEAAHYRVENNVVHFDYNHLDPPPYHSSMPLPSPGQVGYPPPPLSPRPDGQMRHSNAGPRPTKRAKDSKPVAVRIADSPIPRPGSTGHGGLEIPVGATSPSSFRDPWTASVVTDDQIHSRMVWASSPFNPAAGFPPVKLF